VGLQVGEGELEGLLGPVVFFKGKLDPGRVLECWRGVSPSWGRAPYLGRSYRIVGPGFRKGGHTQSKFLCLHRG
jgi:hypothetical protein